MTTKVSMSMCAFGVLDRKDDALADLLLALNAEDVEVASARTYAGIVSLRVVYLTTQTPDEARRTVSKSRNAVFFANDSLVFSARPVR